MASLVLTVSVLGCASQAPTPRAPFSVVEATIPDLRKAMEEGRVTSRQLVEQYLQRIGLYEDRLNAVMAVNPKALEEADRLDQERTQGKIRGPLHGIPVALKDNIHTTTCRPPVARSPSKA